MSHRLRPLYVFILWLGSAAFAAGQTSALKLGMPGVATGEGGSISVAVPLANITKQPLANIEIIMVRFSAGKPRTALPIKVAAIPANASEVIQIDFDAQAVLPAKQYVLELRGTYRVAGELSPKTPLARPVAFDLRTTLALPPGSPGSGEMRKTEVPGNKVKGGRYPHQPPRDKDANQAAPPVPKTTIVPGRTTPNNTEARPAPAGDPPGIVFDANDPVGINGAGQGCSGVAAAVCAEPSGGSGNGVIFVTANWNAAYSTDGGATFTILDPTAIFPNDAVGFCCDQIVQYAPTIDRFIWLLQGSSGYRLAMASSADIKNNNGTAWTYWNLTPGLFGKCTSFDYHDLSVGDHSLYISWDSGGGAAGCTSGFQVARTSLAGIQAGGTITLEFTDPANAPSSKIWGEHLTQDTGDEIFWAGHNGNTKLTVYSLKEGSNTYFWRDVGISSWANNAPTSTTPDGIDWLAKNFNGPGGNSFPRNGIIGAARATNLLWFGWTAGTDNNFRQVHIEIVTLDRANNFNRTQQVQVWNNSYAFAYPAFSSNGCTSELGMSFEYGGNGNYENHVVGFWGDFIAYITTGTDLGDNRFGDYVSIRRAPVTRKDPGNLLTAFGFGLHKKTAAAAERTDVRYVLFGRPTCR